MNRLVNASMTATCTTMPRKAIAYDALGGITKKSDICTAANCYTYGGTGYGPHQLASITGNYNGVTNPTFSYDNNGNMLGGAGFTMSYTAANNMTTLAEGTNAVELYYGAFENRYKMCVPNCTSATTTTSYLYDPMTGAMSDKVVSGSTTTYNDYITVPGIGIVALRNKIGTTVSWYYMALDHLGSISAITDASKSVNERLSYDPWGKRRNANGTDNSACSVTSLTTRGYTGHEMLDSFCLINMNARTYDPSLGRFQAADSIIPDAGYSQAYNRYAYLNDNPLNDTDPTGHSGGQTTCPLVCYLLTSLSNGSQIETVVVTAEREGGNGNLSPVTGPLNNLNFLNTPGDPTGTERAANGRKSAAGKKRGQCDPASVMGAYECVLVLEKRPLTLLESYPIVDNQPNGQKCISLDEPVKWWSAGYEQTIGVGVGISYGHFWTDTGQSGTFVSSGAYGGLGAFLGGAYGTTDSMRDFMGDAYKYDFQLTGPIGGEITANTNGEISGSAVTVGAGGGFWGGKTHTVIKSSTAPICQ